MDPSQQQPGPEPRPEGASPGSGPGSSGAPDGTAPAGGTGRPDPWAAPPEGASPGPAGPGQPGYGPPGYPGAVGQHPAYQPFQQFPGYPMAPVAPSVNGFSIASLISGIVCCMPPLGLVLGVIGLRQIKRKGQRGKGMAITGIALSTVSTLLVTLFLATGAASDVWREFEEAADEVASYKTVEDLRTGHCYNLPGSSDKDGEEVSEVRIVDCAEPHEAEVTGVFKLDGYDSYPGDKALQPVAERRCTAIDRAYALDDWAIPPTMDRYFLTPTAESWKLGDRRVTCSYATEGGKKVKVSVRREAASFDQEQLAYLTAENKVLATIDVMPLEDFPESADGHRAWARATSAALAESSAALKGRKWTGPVDGLAEKRAAEFTSAKAAWDLAARARDDESFWLHVYDADSALKPETEKSIRGHLKLATTEPAEETRT